MKSSIKTMFLVLAIVMSFVAVQAVCAGTVDPTDTITVTGTVKSFHEPTGIVLTDATVDGEAVVEPVTVDGIGPSWFWLEQSAIPAVGDTVSIEVYQLCLSEVDTTLIACSIAINGGDQILLRNDDGTPVWKKKPSATTIALSATAGDGICDGCPGCPGCTCPDCTDCQQIQTRKGQED